MRWQPQPMVGILNSAPARMPVGQREVTAFCLVRTRLGPAAAGAANSLQLQWRDQHTKALAPDHHAAEVGKVAPAGIG